MKTAFSSSRSLQVLGLLALAGAPAVLLLPGCGGGGSNPIFGNQVKQISSLLGTVNLGTTQRGALNLRTFSDKKASGTLTISDLPTPLTQSRQAQATTFATGVFNISGTVDEATGNVNLTGTIPGFGAFSISVTPPNGTSAGSFISTFGGETYSGIIPIVTPTTGPTANPTTGPTANPTTGPTTGPTAPPTGGGLPLGSGPLTISLTSSNTGLSGGSIVNKTGSIAVVDQVGGANRINLVVSNNVLPPTLFNLLVSKTGTFAAGDTVNIQGDAGTNDLVTLLVANLSNPADSASFRGQSGTFRITSVAGKKVSFAVTNLLMVSQTSSASFSLNGSGSFTIG